MAAESKTKHYVNVFLRYFVLILVGLIMIYPLVWMVGATFKSNAEIFSSIGFIPKNPTLEGYKKAMESYGGAINVWKAMLNTFSYVIPKVVFTMISATVTAYGFGRFEFKGRGILFSVLWRHYSCAGSIERTAVHHVFQDGLGRFQVISPDHCADPVRDGYAVRIPADSVPAQRAEGIG